MIKSAELERLFHDESIRKNGTLVHLDPEFKIVGRDIHGNGTLYLGNPDVEYQHVAFTGIGELIPTNTTRSLAYLKAHQVHPINLPRDHLMTPGAVNVKLLNGALTFKSSGHYTAEEIIWLIRDNGFESADYAGFRFVPFASRYIIDNNAQLAWAESGEVVTQALDDPLVRILTDAGTWLDINRADLMLIAFGKYDETNYMNEAVPINTDTDYSGYFALTNWVKDLIVDDEKQSTDLEFDDPNIS